MAGIIRGIARSDIQWGEDPYFSTQIPIKVPNVDMNRFDLKRYYSPEQIEQYIQSLQKERIEYLSKFPDLKKEIRKTIELKETASSN